ncbi:hypothetical protein QLL95_gp0774 [Cotonvirus japonicus]|uniref:Uncharacterized protein n=1 Tax=Cotonvirus japonicus TaxID=2811091 RepID=A0ABM7NT96_9VIRU|nr:hypothetical protein QLL95_gp0774 [Cotonvirus japonicus]BCS83349.1 hypothetical protein [Cotonvirus japonicus]
MGFYGGCGVPCGGGFNNYYNNGFGSGFGNNRCQDNFGACTNNVSGKNREVYYEKENCFNSNNSNFCGNRVADSCNGWNNGCASGGAGGWNNGWGGGCGPIGGCGIVGGGCGPVVGGCGPVVGGCGFGPFAGKTYRRQGPGTKLCKGLGYKSHKKD